MPRTAIERETIILFNEEESTATVYTYNKPLIRKLNKLLESRSDIQLQSGDEECSTFIVPKKWIKVTPPRATNYTEEQRQLIGERLKNAKNQN